MLLLLLRQRQLKAQQPESRSVPGKVQLETKEPECRSVFREVHPRCVLECWQNVFFGSPELNFPA
jgi:hypothetical protein